MTDHPLRRLPAVNEILQSPYLQDISKEHAHSVVVEAIREELAQLRSQYQKNPASLTPLNPDQIATRVGLRLDLEMRPLLRKVINATGIVLHTNLGRAPLAEDAAKQVQNLAQGYLNLELDLQDGKRSSRQIPIRKWICKLTGAESATVVNNNAAATIIALRSICHGKEAIVSRGQLIEIGGSFRIPDIMEVSGATLKEVGTTNITRLSDYEKAIGPNTGALMQIHPSNYRIRGFTKSVSLTELVALGKKYHLPVIDDVGSGALLDLSLFGLEGEPLVQDSIAQGADLVLFSGDKLLGGPQAGILAGKKEWIGKIEKDPLMRAFRLDKMTLVALELTLRHYLHMEKARTKIPALRMMTMPLDLLQKRTEDFAQRLRQISELESIAVCKDVAYVGGGSLPDQALPTYLVILESSRITESALAFQLRQQQPAIMARIKEGKLALDLRTVFPEEEDTIFNSLNNILKSSLSKA